MSRIKVVSFDAEGTLVTPDFSEAIWQEAMPALYAQKHGLEFEQARRSMIDKYAEVGDQKIEWYNIRYWFDLLALGDPGPAIERCLDKASCYPEVNEVLSSLKGKYQMVVSSGTPIDFLNHLLRDIDPFFSHVFSSTSHYQQIKCPEFYLAICQQLKVEPGEVAHVGDSRQFDFLIPQQIGINAFYLDRSGKEREGALVNLSQLESRLQD
ncbi:MAG: HAD family hydrolase [Dehalococcoidia bacterium]|nr:HAD family hydrolase [Dehalococcoidia bacterium]